LNRKTAELLNGDPLLYLTVGGSLVRGEVVLKSDYKSDEVPPQQQTAETQKQWRKQHLELSD
jgi:hypothetical protein